MSFYVSAESQKSPYTNRAATKNIAPHLVWFCILAYFIIGCLICIPTLWSGVKQSHDIRGYKQQVERAENRNKFYEGVKEGKILTGEDSPEAHLQTDLGLFMKATSNVATGATNPFGPTSLTDVRLPEGKYDGLYYEMGPIVYAGEFSDGTHDHDNYGTMEDWFINNYLDAYAGKSVVEAIPDAHAGDDLDLTVLSGLPYWQFALGIWLILNFTIVQMVGHYQPSSGEYKQHHGGANTLFGMIVAPGYFVPLFFYLWHMRGVKKKAVHTAQKQQIIAEQKEQERLLNHPLRGHLYTARVNLRQLESLASADPESKELAKAVKDQKKFVAEMETFPDKLTRQSALQLAAQIRNENDLAWQDADALLQARDEANKL